VCPTYRLGQKLDSQQYFKGDSSRRKVDENIEKQWGAGTRWGLVGVCQKMAEKTLPLIIHKKSKSNKRFKGGGWKGSEQPPGKQVDWGMLCVILIRRCSWGWQAHTGRCSCISGDADYLCPSSTIAVFTEKWGVTKKSLQTSEERCGKLRNQKERKEEETHEILVVTTENVFSRLGPKG